MFIPVVGEWYIGARVLLQSVDLANTLFKMGINSFGYESPISNTIEAVGQGLSFGTSEQVTGNQILGT